MAGVRFKVTNNVATGTSAKTVLQLVAAANHAVLLKELTISFAGTSNTAAPVRVKVARQTTAGTMTALTTEVKDPDGAAETIQTTAFTVDSAEPTVGDVLLDFYVHPQTGYTWQAPFGQDIRIPGGGRLGVVVTAGADVSCSVTAVCEE